MAAATSARARSAGMMGNCITLWSARRAATTKKRIWSGGVHCTIVVQRGNMRSAKRKGTRNEHRTIELLERSGYRTTRAAGSFGVWDGISVNEQGFILFQCKTNKSPSRKEIEAMKS